MKKKSGNLKKQLQDYYNYLSKPPQSLKEYAEYIDFFNTVKEAMGGENDVKLAKAR